MVWFDGEQPTSGVKWGWPVCGPKNRAAEGEKLTRCNGAAVACLAFPKPLVRRCGEGGGEGEAEFMPVAAVHPPSPTPRSYLVEFLLSRVIAICDPAKSPPRIPPRNRAPYTHTYTYTRSFLLCQTSPLVPAIFSFCLVPFVQGFNNFAISFSCPPSFFSRGGRCFERFTINLSNEIQDRDQ